MGLEDCISDEESEEEKKKVAAQKHSDSNVILVHGAFGCGKSYLLVSLIRFVATLLD